MNRKNTTRILSAAIVLLMTLALAVPALAVTTYVIATDDTTVRKGPGTSYSSLGTLEEGEAARKLGTSGVWTKIDFDGDDGYVKTADVDTYSGDDLIDPHHRKPEKPIPPRKIDERLPLTSCFTAPCTHGCPVNQDIPEYITLVSKGKHLKALRVITEKNPLPFITGVIHQ